MFEQFRTVDNMSDLSTSRALENHALLVMNALDEAMTNMDDREYMVEMLLTTGKSHRRFEQFGAHVFWVRFQVISNLLAMTLFYIICNGPVTLQAVMAVFIGGL